MVCLCAVFCTRVRAKVQHTTVSGVYCCCRCKLVGTILVPAERPRVLSSTAFAAHQAGRAVSCASEVRSRTKNKHLHTCTPAARKRVYFQHLPPPLCMHDPGTCTCSCALPAITDHRWSWQKLKVEVQGHYNRCIARGTSSAHTHSNNRMFRLKKAYLPGYSDTRTCNALRC